MLGKKLPREKIARRVKFVSYFDPRINKLVYESAKVLVAKKPKQLLERLSCRRAAAGVQ